MSICLQWLNITDAGQRLMLVIAQLITHVHCLSASRALPLSDCKNPVLSVWETDSE